MNLGGLQTELQSLGYGTDTVSVQTQALNSIYRRIQGMYRWPWLEGQGTVTAVVGNPVVDISTLTGAADIDAVRIEYSGQYPEIRWLPPQQFRSLEHSDRTNGPPRYWSYLDSQVRLWPRPDRPYTVTVDYVLSLPDMVLANVDSPAFDARFHDVLVWGAAAFLAHRQRDWTAMNFAQANYEARLAEMRRHYGISQRQNARQVRHSKFWDSVGRTFE